MVISTWLIEFYNLIKKYIFFNSFSLYFFLFVFFSPALYIYISVVRKHKLFDIFYKKYNVFILVDINFFYYLIFL